MSIGQFTQRKLIYIYIILPMYCRQQVKTKFLFINTIRSCELQARSSNILSNAIFYVNLHQSVSCILPTSNKFYSPAQGTLSCFYRCLNLTIFILLLLSYKYRINGIIMYYTKYNIWPISI